MYVLRYKQRNLIKEISIRKARKTHICYVCKNLILPGENYIRITLGNLSLRRFKSFAICINCWRRIKSNNV